MQLALVRTGNTGVTPTMVHDLASQAQAKYDPANIWPFRKWWDGRWGEGRAAVHPCIYPSYSALVLYIRYI